MKEENKKKSLMLLVIGVLVLLIIIAGATYAYFQAQIGEGKSTDATFITDTTDNLTFIVGGNISINANLDNFGKDNGGENQDSESTATANLIANSTLGTTEQYKYNIYLEVDKNDFEYVSYKKTADVELGEDTLKFMTKYEKTLGNNDDYRGVTNGYEGIPELFLTIISPEGTEYTTAINGLGKHYIEEFAKSETETDPKVGGYDITELREGIYPLIEDEVIQVTDKEIGQKTDEWKIRVTLKYLTDTDQQLNAGKTFKGKIIIQSEKIPTDLMDVCASGANLANCIKKLHDESNYAASNLIYHDGQPDYKEETNASLEAGDESYRYTGSYEKVNNYVCFGEGSNAEKCPDNNLYRIIGTFKNETGQYETKLIKADYASKEDLGTGTEKEPSDDSTPGSYWDYTTYGPIGNEKNINSEKDTFAHRYKGNLTEVDRYRWQENGDTNTQANWSNALLNKQHLNIEFYNHLIGNSEENVWSKLIAQHDWIYASTTSTWVNVGEADNAKIAYNNEVGDYSKGTQLTDSENIGLMYVSDYLYGASQEHWNKKGYNEVWTYNADTYKDISNNPVGKFDADEINTDYRSATADNWLYMGIWEWLITQRQDYAFVAFDVDATGIVAACDVGYCTVVVRPSFYLTSSAQLKGGSGTIDDPYTLVVADA